MALNSAATDQQWQWQPVSGPSPIEWTAYQQLPRNAEKARCLVLMFLDWEDVRPTPSLFAAGGIWPRESSPWLLYWL